jgi:signal transduction histidine kinase
VAEGIPTEWVGRFDPGQIEQAVLNLLKNAHESGSVPEAREIAEAHDGRIALANREGGGLVVALTLPE